MQVCNKASVYLKCLSAEPRRNMSNYVVWWSKYFQKQECKVSFRWFLHLFFCCNAHLNDVTCHQYQSMYCHCKYLTWETLRYLRDATLWDARELHFFNQTQVSPLLEVLLGLSISPHNYNREQFHLSWPPLSRSPIQRSCLPCSSPRVLLPSSPAPLPSS